ncbi:MAG: hypothetical protein M3Y68_10275 [Chloroflexota bacterium]|nr:hypothetical protein [Chloroflexota bacterium]
MKDILEKVMADPRYRKNIEYGEPRPGHPEGRIKFHIAELEGNLERLVTRGISEEQYWKLKFLIHVHDTFKADATPDSPILSPNSHASLARKFAAEFLDDKDLLNMIQLHDVNYALWLQFDRRGSYNLQRLHHLLDSIQDWDLFLMFLIIDGSTPGKERSKLIWFLREAARFRKSKVDESWVL